MLLPLQCILPQARSGFLKYSNSPLLKGFRSNSEEKINQQPAPDLLFSGGPHAAYTLPTDGRLESEKQQPDAAAIRNRQVGP